MQPLSQRGGAPAQDQQASRRAHGQGCIRAGTGGDERPPQPRHVLGPQGLQPRLQGPGVHHDLHMRIPHRDAVEAAQTGRQAAA